jgi:hypothetical protein
MTERYSIGWHDPRGMFGNTPTKNEGGIEYELDTGEIVNDDDDA